MTSNQKEITELIKRISGQANILAVPRIYIDILGGDINSAIILSQLVYWSDKGGRNGWIYKSFREWTEETSLSQYQVTRCADKLKYLALIETDVRLANAAPTTHYKVDMETLTNTIIKFLNNGLLRNLIMDYEETQQSDYKETSQSDYEETQQSLTEITTEITTEINAETSSSVIDDDETLIDFYQSNIGVCTPIILGKIEAADKKYPTGWVRKAIEASAASGGRSWAYVETVLVNWEKNGLGWKPGDSRNKRDKESEDNYRRYLAGEFAEFIK